VPTVSWHKDGKEVKASDRLTMKNDHISAHLEVPKSVHADAGVYTITLENKLGSATASINVKVIGNSSVMKHQPLHIQLLHIPEVVIASSVVVYKQLQEMSFVPGVVAHTFNPSTQEAEAGRFLSSRQAWSTE
jgi:hypothetical protein